MIQAAATPRHAAEERGGEQCGGAAEERQRKAEDTMPTLDGGAGNRATALLGLVFFLELGQLAIP